MPIFKCESPRKLTGEFTEHLYIKPQHSFLTQTSQNIMHIVLSGKFHLLWDKEGRVGWHIRPLQAKGLDYSKLFPEENLV